MSKHKPGPWVAVIDINYDHFEIRDKNGRRIAVCTMDYPMSAGTHDANARLIAAAPELLHELEDRYQQTKCGCGHPACKRCQDDRMTEMVLAKARGEE
jgi:hypothetical protein